MYEPFNTLLGLTLQSVEKGENRDGETLVFTTDTGRVFEMYHSQDCCECVTLEDICGDLQDLVGSPIIRAEENSSDRREETDPEPKDDPYGDVHEWTFYRIATAKGLVVLRWYGSSNGYYSTSVGFHEKKS